MRAILNSVRRAAIVLAVGTAALVTGFDLVAPSSATVHAATVSRIDVEGNRRVETATIRSYVVIRPNRPFGASQIDISIRALFKTGLFSDVKINQRGRILVVTVVENPVINKVSFEGNKKIKDDVLKVAVSSKPRTVLTRSRVQSDVQKILTIYRNQGRFRARVEPKIINLSRNRVNLVFEISDGPKTGVARITFIGNRHFSDSRLREVIKTRESGLLSWLRTTDTYDAQRLEADSQLLRQYYFRYGYADFRILSAVADLDRERNEFLITITVDEGERYTFGEINIQSSVPEIDPSSLRGVITTFEGDVYNATKVQKSMEAIVLEVSKNGYAFSVVNPRGERDFENRKIAVTYVIDEGSRTYVERIQVFGNTRTREYVIRREFDFAEGDAYNQVLVKKAERRLNALRFFKSVRITTSRGSAPDRVDVNVHVVEQSTGAVSFGAGYSTLDGVVADVSLTERNFLGRGQFVKIAVGGGEHTRTYEFSITEPFIGGYRLSAGLDVYRTETGEGDSKSYSEISTGAGIRLGFDVTDELRARFHYKIQLQDIRLDQNKRTRLNVPWSTRNSQGETLISLLGYSLVYSTLDNRSNPHNGIHIRFGQDVAGLGGDVQYLRSQIDGSYFRELFPQYGVVGLARLSGGYVFGLGQSLRSTDHFFLGGERIRGFETNGIGPRRFKKRNAVNAEPKPRDAVGGRIFVAGTVETKFPLPVIPKDLGFSGSFFFDAGTLIDPDPVSTRRDRVRGDAGLIRSSAGFSLGWDSPMGPLRANFAWPITKGKYDKTQLFRISGGRRF